MRLALVVFILGIAAASCKKNDCPNPMVENIDISPDTILPHSYFPAYPDSWWKYSDSTVVSVKDEMYPVDEKYTNVNLPCPEIDIMRRYVPVIGDSAIEYNVRYFYNSSGVTRRIQMFPTDGEIYWETEGPTPHKLWLLDSDASIIVEGVLYENVKVVRMESWSAHSSAPDFIAYVDTTYFADSVGIIKSVLYDTYPTTELIYDRELVDYLINF